MASSLVIIDGDVAGLLACAAAVEPALCLVWPPNADPDSSLLRRKAAERQAALYGMPVVPAPDGSADHNAAERMCRMLMEACFQARKRGAGSVIWPASAGEDLDLDRAAAAVDRALLAGRLASVGEERPVEIRLPYVDFTDRHLADLVLDMDLPIWTCWWYDAAGNPSAERERQRWEALLQGAGWRGELPGPELGIRTGRGKTVG